MKIVSMQAALLLAATTLGAAQVDDPAYTAEIRRQTTEPRFATELVDHLPASSTVPSPLAHHGYIAGAEGRLTYAEDVAAYMRALAAASPRVEVLSAGRSEEGREMIVVAISDAATIRDLDRYRDVTAKLADPRRLDASTARRLIADGKPFYWATGAMHSPETGSPEMMMELAYRLAVEETPLVREIRRNVVTLLTPVLEVDGRDRMVDLWRYRQAHPELPTPPLVYWGHYVAHDNNRDQIGMTLKLSQNVTETYFRFHPQVIHDLHESIPFLYISTGTGPYNPALDPLVVDEWYRMAFHEVDELTRRGLPGVWTHGFYDGWAPNYMVWAGMGHNSVGRFYETFGNRWPITAKRVVRGTSDRAWYRQNPPLPEVTWSLRDNVNYQQSGVLVALSDMAQHRERFLERFYELGKRSIAKASNEGPTAYVIPATEKRRGELFDLLTLLRRHRIEVSVTEGDAKLTNAWPPKASQGGQATAEAEDPVERKDSAPEASTPEEAERDAAPEPIALPAGSFVIRMDQPYSRLADTLLDTQYVRGEERVYDDTGWTLGYLKNVGVRRVVDPAVLELAMHPWDGVLSTGAAPPGPLAIPNVADVDLARLRFAAPEAALSASDAEFTVGEGDAKRVFPAGTVLSDGIGIGKALAELHLEVTPLAELPAVATHPLRVPRIGLIHSWLDTQDEGWWRIALDSLGVPYDYLSTQDVAAPAGGDLRQRYDVLLFPPVGEDPVDVVNGLAPGPALPWKKSETTPNLGAVDSTSDMRPGLGLPGVVHLQRFVEEGGLLITARDTSELAVQYGLARWVSKAETEKLKAPGTIVRASVKDASSAVTAGYDDTLPVYFAGGPVFEVGAFHFRKDPPRPSGRGGKDDPDVPQGRPFVPVPERPKAAAGEEGFQLPDDAPWNFEPYLPRPEDRPRVVLAFAEAKELFLSGMLEGGDEIAGKPAVIDAPRGKGHILLMSINPMWRGNTQGTYALVTNALLNWDHLR